MANKGTRKRKINVIENSEHEIKLFNLYDERSSLRRQRRRGFDVESKLKKVKNQIHVLTEEILTS